MTFIINPGSGAVPEAGNGWTNTYDGALAEAKKWLGRIRAEGIADVSITIREREPSNGRWRFGFEHSVTGVVVWLETPGIDDWKAYEAEHVFTARIYWKGSSSSEPQLEDWHAPGFRALRTFIRDAEAGE